ncbi:hypothetical protein ACJX0J_024191, partial [Zea mays]
SFSCLSCCLSLILYDVRVNKLIKKNSEPEVTDGSQLVTTIPYFCNYSVHVEDKNFIMHAAAGNSD